MKKVYISVSTDPVSSYQEIIEYAKSIQGSADFLHCDVMDGNFVEKQTYDYQLIRNINQNTALPLDVHLMVSEPVKDVKKYIEAGANILTVHYEAFNDKNELADVIELIRQQNGLAGLSFIPETPFKDVKPFCFNIDVLLVMSVEPGASGQKFMTETLAKIKEIDAFRQKNNLNFKIEVDGGVNGENAADLISSGVDILVSGNYVYKAKSRSDAIKELRGE